MIKKEEIILKVPGGYHEQKSHYYRIFKEMKNEDKWRKILENVRLKVKLYIKTTWTVRSLCLGGKLS